MAEDGIVGEFKSGSAREVLYSWEEWEALKNGGAAAGKEEAAGVSELGVRRFSVGIHSLALRARVQYPGDGRNPNPTLDTLARYAMAVDMGLKLSAVPLPADEAD